jgi:hypothetical protein
MRRSLRPGQSEESVTETPLARAIMLRAKLLRTSVEMRLL